MSIKQRCRRENCDLSEFIHKLYNVSLLMYHFVYPAKYRKSLFNPEVQRFRSGDHVKTFKNCNLISVTVFILSSPVIDRRANKLLVPVVIVFSLISMIIFIRSIIFSRQGKEPSLNNQLF